MVVRAKETRFCGVFFKHDKAPVLFYWQGLLMVKSPVPLAEVFLAAWKTPFPASQYCLWPQDRICGCYKKHAPKHTPNTFKAATTWLDNHATINVQLAPLNKLKTNVFVQPQQIRTQIQNSHGGLISLWIGEPNALNSQVLSWTQ